MKSAIREIIADHQSQLARSSRRNAPSIVKSLVRESWQIFRKDQAIFEMVTSAGWGTHVRALLKSGPDDPPSPDQLSLWSPRQQQLIADIGVAAVWVPSANGFVPLMPEEITSDEVSEAAKYLEKKAKDTMKRAEFLHTLARNMRRMGQ